MIRKAKLKSSEDKTCLKLKLQSTTYKWEGQSFPFIEESYSYGNETVVVGSYISSEDAEFEKFLFAVMRESSLPKWIKNNILKIKKKIRDEIKHRSKLNEKLTKEQKEAIGLFFHDTLFFDRDDQDEYFELELDRSSMYFLRSLLMTPNYESFVRQGVRRRKATLTKYG
jgi:hypothetical protein